jgi:hypothetical protein
MNMNTNINNTIASATTTAANNLLTDVTTWKETALNLSRILSDQTDIVNLLNKKLIELACKNEELSKENAKLRSKVEILTKSNTFEEDEVMTKIIFVDNRNYDKILYIAGEIRLKDLTKEMQETFKSHCTNHLGETDFVIKNCLIELDNFDNNRIEVEIKDRNDIILSYEGKTVEEFIDEYNKFIAARNS